MSELVKVSPKGLLTLPKSIRQQLNIDVGDYLDVTIETGKVILQKVDIRPKKIDWENEDD
ncbi:MAG: AbrB/MazE/SpoVT family DNA-binding domain-containing protein, partial [Candidatus Methanoperedens sp.]|nr:AbrB/MazE/SpoVT family DNA-binding domain-containing protein [Candidatus Methanoperedens sp.]